MQLDAGRRDTQRLSRQLSQQHAAKEAALAAAARDSRHQRECLAGDLEGATTAMQDAVRRLAASEAHSRELGEALAAEQQQVQQLKLDVLYLRQRAAGARTAAAAAQ